MFGPELRNTGIVQQKIKDVKKQTKKKKNNNEIFQNDTRSAAVTRVLQAAVDLSVAGTAPAYKRNSFIYQFIYLYLTQPSNLLSSGFFVFKHVAVDDLIGCIGRSNDPILQRRFFFLPP